MLVRSAGAIAGGDGLDRHAAGAVIGVLSAAAVLHEPLGVREITALVVTLGGVTMALRS